MSDHAVLEEKLFYRSTITFSMYKHLTNRIVGLASTVTT